MLGVTDTFAVYKALSLDPATPPLVRSLIRAVENHYLSDVHTMLKLPQPRYALRAGCNFAIANVLLATISGLSVTLYRGAGSSGAKFKGLLQQHYPWHREPQTKVTGEEAAETIYMVFRNPLTHDLGMDLERKAKTPAVMIKRLITAKKTRGLPERWIETLESTSGRIRMSPTVTIRSDATVLLIEALYWGIRCLIEDITKHPTLMAQSESFLEGIRK